MVDLLRGIFAATICGDFLLALIILQLSALRGKRESAKTTDFPSEKPPDADTDEARRVRDAREDAEAFQRLMNYSAADAYGGGEGG